MRFTFYDFSPLTAVKNSSCCLSLPTPNLLHFSCPHGVLSEGVLSEVVLSEGVLSEGVLSEVVLSVFSCPHGVHSEGAVSVFLVYLFAIWISLTRQPSNSPLSEVCFKNIFVLSA